MKKIIATGLLVTSIFSYAGEVCIISGKLDSSDKPTVQCSDIYTTEGGLRRGMNEDAEQTKLFGSNIATALNYVVDKKSYALQSTVVTPDGTLTYTLIKK